MFDHIDFEQQTAYFENKMSGKIEKSIETFLDKVRLQAEFASPLRITESQMFPADSRKEIITQIRLLFNNINRELQFKEYEEKDFNDFLGSMFVKQTLSTIVRPLLRIETPFINEFYEKILNDLEVTARTNQSLIVLSRTRTNLILAEKGKEEQSIRISFTTQRIEIQNKGTIPNNLEYFIEFDFKQVLFARIHSFLDYIKNELLENNAPCLVFRMGLYSYSRNEYIFGIKNKIYLRENGNFERRTEKMGSKINMSKKATTAYNLVYSKLQETISIHSYYVLNIYGSFGHSAATVLSEVFHSLNKEEFKASSENPVFIKELNKNARYLKDYGAFSGEDLSRLFDLYRTPNLEEDMKKEIKNFFI